MCSTVASCAHMQERLSIYHSHSPLAGERKAEYNPWKSTTVPLSEPLALEPWEVRLEILQFKPQMIPVMCSHGAGSLFFFSSTRVRGAQRKTPRLSMRHNYVRQLYRQNEQSQRKWVSRMNRSLKTDTCPTSGPIPTQVNRLSSWLGLSSDF